MFLLFWRDALVSWATTQNNEMSVRERKNKNNNVTAFTALVSVKSKKKMKMTTIQCINVKRLYLLFYWNDLSEKM